MSEANLTNRWRGKLHRILESPDSGQPLQLAAANGRLLRRHRAAHVVTVDGMDESRCESSSGSTNPILPEWTA